uniref:Ribonuclease H-like domain-containing protein n=1 Tax=Tanacetum cinerariifolium TaxID=118510 RepID=A0A6L2L1H1_TANCI|nr:ribonuclease H-like domain-containing protein [Tanacetum cinerariifolium]
MDDVRDIWNAVKARFSGNDESKKMRKYMLKQEFSEFRIGKAEGLHKGYDRMQKILSQLNQLKAKPEDEDINLKFLRALPSSWSQDAGRKIDFDKKESARFNKKKRYSSFKNKDIGKKEEDLKALITVDTLVDWTDHDGESDGVIASKEFGMIAGCDTKDAIKESAAKIYNLITGADIEEASTASDVGEFARMGVTSENNANVETTKKDLQTKLDNHLIQIEKWRISSKNLFRWIDSSMPIRTKVGLGFNNYIRENELGWDDSSFSAFTTNSEDVEGRPLFHKFAKADSMKVLPPPLSGDYTSLSDHSDLDESQMSYGTNSSTSSDSKSMSNDFIFYDDSDKSLEVNTNDFVSSDSSVKSLEPMPNDSTSCASTSSVSTSEHEAEIESNVGTPIQEPIIVQDLPSFSCISSNKNENTSRTSCNKNGYFNKKACHFKKHALSVSKLCFVCGSGTHLIKDCDFYEKQMDNKTVGIRVDTVHCRNKVNHQNHLSHKLYFLGLARPFPVPTDRGYSSSVSSGWWKSTARPMPHFSRPTSTYFQTYTPYVPTMSYNHMTYGGDRWETIVKPSASCSLKSHRKVLYWENPFSDAEVEGIFDSGCSRSMTAEYVAATNCCGQSVAGLRFSEDSSMLLTFGIQCCWFEFKYADAAFSRDIPLNMYVVPIGRVVVPTGRASALGFYQMNNANPSYQEQRQSMEESLRKFTTKSAKRNEQNSNLMKEIQASTDAAIRNQGSSIMALEIQIEQMIKVLQEKGYVVPAGRVVVHTGRVVVPTGRYVVPTDRVVVPTGRVVVPSGRIPGLNTLSSLLVEGLASTLEKSSEINESYSKGGRKSQGRSSSSIKSLDSLIFSPLESKGSS